MFAMKEMIRQNNPSYMKKEIGFLDSLLSPTNKNGFARASELIDARSGKLMQSRVVYQHRGLVDSVADEITCDTPTSRVPEHEETLSVDQEIMHSFSLKESEWQSICMDETQAELQFYIQDCLRAAREKLNLNVLTDTSSSLIGVNLANIVSETPSSSAKVLNILNSDGSSRAQFAGEFQQDMLTNLQARGHNIVGAGNMYKFLVQNELGCCNDLGFDIGAINRWMADKGYAFWLDQYAEEAIGENNYIVYSPGSLQLLTINRFKGPYAKRADNNFAKFVIPDPVLPGLSWDIYADYDPCEDKQMGEYKWRASLYYKMWGLPDEAYDASDELRGMNNVFLYNFAQAT